jgi:predicted DsbA family dithiol-disulfide isomerase
MMGLLLVFVFFATASSAEVLDASLLRTLGVRESIRQVAVTADGERIYILTEKGNVEILDREGRSQGGIAVGPDIIGITPQGKDRLLLQSKNRHQLLQLILEPRAAISIEGAPIHGNRNAPVTIVIFDDFECPYCSRTVALLDTLLHDYQGEVRVVFKNFPLKMHEFSRLAAIAGLAAQRQGKFWKLHDLLFANYNDLNQKKIETLAQQAGLDMEQFKQDLLDPVLEKQIQDEITEGKTVGVKGTPTLFVNGRKVHKRTYAAISQMIDDELARLASRGM